MLVIDNGDAIRGIAEVASKLDFIVSGYVGTAATQLADGQLGTGEANLYQSGANATVVTSIIIVNTDSSARTFTLYLKASGDSRAISPVSLDLGVGYSFYTDGQRMVVVDKLGAVVSSYGSHASSHTDGTDDIQTTSTSQKGIVQLDGTAGGTNAEVVKPPTSDAFYDHAVATSGVHGASGNTILYSDHTSDVDAHGEVVITTEDSNTATSNDLALTIAAGEGINTTSTGSTVTITGEDASTTNKGVVELAIGSEVNTGTSTVLAVTPDALDDWTGSAQITTVGTLSSGDVTAQVSAATTSTAGKSELAVASEINDGDDTGRTISPKELSDSNYGKRIMYIKVLAFDTALTTGDGKAYITIPIELNGMNLVLAHAAVYTKSSGGLPEVSLERSTDHSAWNDILSTAITIDVNEWSSYEATTAPVINGSYDDASTGDWIRVNVDAAGTGTKGLDIILTYQLP